MFIEVAWWDAIYSADQFKAPLAIQEEASILFKIFPVHTQLSSFFCKFCPPKASTETPLERERVFHHFDTLNMCPVRWIWYITTSPRGFNSDKSTRTGSLYCVLGGLFAASNSIEAAHQHLDDRYVQVREMLYTMIIASPTRLNCHSN